MNVTFTGGSGNPGSTLNWNLINESNTDTQVSDNNDDGNLDEGSDTWVVTGDPNIYTFTGYTITSGGTEYGVFSNGTLYYVPINEDGVGQSTIGTSGTSNVFQSEAAAYLCYGPGTLISAPLGDVSVETLQIGDLVQTVDGKHVSVKWIGRQTVSTRFRPADRMGLVRFAAGSLGEGLPHTDLTVTADHGMLVDGVICHAGALVNGTTITRVPLSEMGDTFTVYHIETEEHEIILANGTPAETFIDNVSRRVFDNYAEFEALYGDVPEMEELPYPRAMSARQVPERLKLKLDGQRAA